jgi:hypothetical protein
MAIAAAADLCASHAVVNGAGHAKAGVNLALELAAWRSHPTVRAPMHASCWRRRQHELAAERRNLMPVLPAALLLPLLFRCCLLIPFGLRLRLHPWLGVTPMQRAAGASRSAWNAPRDRFTAAARVSC